MRTYDVVDDATGAVLRSVEVEDQFRPAVLAGQSLVLTHANGEKLAASSRATVGTPTGDADPKPMPEVLVTAADAAAERAAAKAEREEAAAQAEAEAEKPRRRKASE